MSNAKSSGRRDAMFFFGGGRGCGWRWAAVGKRHSKSNYEPTLRQQEQEKQQEKQQQSQRGLARRTRVDAAISRVGQSSQPGPAGLETEGG